jgi:uncharacterized membrane protein YcaP (DUF421 family)
MRLVSLQFGHWLTSSGEKGYVSLIKEPAMAVQDMFFSGWSELGRTVVVGTLAYIAVVLLLRGVGKRALTKMRAYDFVVTVALGSSLATALLSSQVKIDKAVLGFALLLGLQRLVAWLSTRWGWFHDLVNNEPTLVFIAGRC